MYYVSPDPSLEVKGLAPPDQVADGMQMSVLTLGVEFLYSIPTFSVIKVPLRQVTVQIEDDCSGSVHLFDGFIRSEPSLGASTTHIPSIISLKEHCFVSVSSDRYCSPSLDPDP